MVENGRTYRCGGDGVVKKSGEPRPRLEEEYFTLYGQGSNSFLTSVSYKRLPYCSSRAVLEAGLQLADPSLTFTCNYLSPTPLLSFS